MKQFWQKGIIGIIMLAIFMAPVSLLIQVDKNNNLALEVETKNIWAQNIDPNFIITPKDTSIEVNITIKRNYLAIDTDYVLLFTLFDKDKTGTINKIPDGDVDVLMMQEITNISRETIKTDTAVKSITIEKLIPKHNYILVVTLIEDSFFKDIATSVKNSTSSLLSPFRVQGYVLKFLGSVGLDFSEKEIPYRVMKEFTTNSNANTNDGTVGKTIDQTPANFSCGITNLGGCVLQIFYVIWQASAWIATVAGGFLDFFIYYSTNSDSYSNTFVEKAWAAVRDIANIFFIIALFYVAVKTILGLNVSNNKKLVGMVIVIGLIINFSLFTTKVIIDSSNILAKVFYNNITSTDAKTQQDAVGKEGQKQISVGLVNKFNPQNIVMDAYKSGLGLGYCIFIVLLLIAVTLYTAYIFFSVALLFVARVVSLWISMIFSPMAFASYTVPFEVPGFGHKEWWTELIKNAMLAPLFIFMLYIIVLFAGFLTEIVKYQSDADTMQKLMSIIIPFIILMVLLKKSKELAQKYAGEMGGAITKFAGMATGLVAGATIGTTAALGQATLGHIGKRVFESKTLANWETDKNSWAKRKLGRTLRTIGGGDDGKGGFAGSSFDLRKGAASGILTATSGLTGLNLGQKSKFLMKEDGGYEADLARREAKRLKRAEGLKVKEGETEKQKLNKLQEEHRVLSLGSEAEIHELDKKIAGAKAKRETLKEVANGILDKNSEEYKAAKKNQSDAAKKVQELENEKKKVKKGMKENSKGEYNTDNKLRSINSYEDEISKLEGDKDAAKEAQNKAEETLSKAENNIKEARDKAEEANKKAIEIEQKLGSSLTPSDIAQKEAARNAVLEANKEVINAETNFEKEKANRDTIKSNLENITKEHDKKIKEFETLKEEDKKDRAQGGKGKIGYSQDYYEDALIPHAEHAIKHINDKRTGNYADIIEDTWVMPWNQAARSESAHKIRMGVKAEHHGKKDHGHGGGFFEHLIETAAVHKIVGGGDDHGAEHKTDSQAHTEEHK